MMSFLFGNKKPTPLAPSKAIEKLNETVSLLEKRETHLDKQIASLKEQAKNCVQQNNKNRAILFLKKAKLLEKELDSIIGQKFNLETQISALTQAITNTHTITALKASKDSLSGLESKIDPDKVGDTMDEISDNISRLDEVSDAMSRPLGAVMDEDELLKELADMSINETTTAKKEKEKEQIILPDIPDKVFTQNKKEEDELKELDLLMNS